MLNSHVGHSSYAFGTARRSYFFILNKPSEYFLNLKTVISNAELPLERFNGHAAIFWQM